MKIRALWFVSHFMKYFYCYFFCKRLTRWCFYPQNENWVIPCICMGFVPDCEAYLTGFGFILWISQVITSSESSPVDTVVPVAVTTTSKRSRKTSKTATVTATTFCTAPSRKKDQLCKKLERRRTKSEPHDDDDDDDDADDVVLHTVSTRLRLSSSYKEG